MAGIGLWTSLGYEVSTFVRTEGEVATIAGYRPFRKSLLQGAEALNIGFLARPLSSEARKTLLALKTDIDDFHVQGREVYWLCRRKQSGSTFSNVLFERTLKVRATFRAMSTITKLAAKIRSVGGGRLTTLRALGGRH